MTAQQLDHVTGRMELVSERLQSLSSHLFANQMDYLSSESADLGRELDDIIISIQSWKVEEPK